MKAKIKMTIKKYRPYLTAAQISRILKYALDAGDTDLIECLHIFAFKASEGYTKPSSESKSLEEKLGFIEISPDEEANLFQKIIES